MKQRKWQKIMMCCLMAIIMMLTGVGVIPETVSVEAAEDKLSYEVSLEVKDAATYKFTTTGEASNLNDGDLNTNYQPVYQRKDGGNVYKETGILADSFYMILDLGGMYDLSTIAICWFPNGGRAYKYNVEVSSDKLAWTKVADHAANTTEKNTITDTLTGNAGRYIRIEILGNYRASDNSHSVYFPTSEITVKGEVQQENKLSYEVSLEVKDTNVYKFTTTYDASNLNDGNVNTNYQPIYQRKDGGNVYKETGLLADSFYMILDLGGMYDLSSIAICCYPGGGRAYKYNVEVSSDKLTWTKAADHSANTTEKNTITDTLTGNAGRYIRIEILGNYRASDNSSSAYFPISEITVKGEPKPEDKLSYEVSLEVKDADVYKFTTTYDASNLNDGNVNTNYQPVYQRQDGGDVYKEVGLLKDSFYMILDLGDLYDLSSIAICCYPNGGRAYKYNVEVSSDKLTWKKVADHSANTTEKNTITDTLTDSVGRYVRIEILGNYRASDNSSSAYFPISEITINGDKVVDSFAAQVELFNDICVHFSGNVKTAFASQNLFAKLYYMDQEYTMDLDVTDGGKGYTAIAFSFDGMLPQNICEKITVAIYVDEMLLVEYKDYSIQQYCLNLLENPETTEKTRNLLIALLNYGAESQKYFGGATEGFANDQLSAEEIASVNQNMGNAQTVKNSGSKADADNYWKSATVALYNNIHIRLKFYTENVANVVVKINGVEYTDFEAIGNGIYYVDFDQFAAHQFDASIDAELIVDGECVHAITYSVNSYINSYANEGKDHTDASYALIQSIYNYGCAAHSYVG